jgi:integrase
MQVRLTAEFVRQVTTAAPPIRDTTYFDTDLRRFALRVMPPKRAGEQWPAWYFVRYTPRGGGAERRLKCGDPRTMDLAKARVAARALLGAADGGGDPAAVADANRAAWTVSEAWERFQVSPEFAKCMARTQEEKAATMRLHVLRHVGSTKLANINVPAVRRLHRAVEADQRTNTRERRLGGPGAARQAVRALSGLLSWCVGEGRLDRNPIIGSLRLAGGGERSTVLSTTQQYSSLFTTMDRMVDEGRLRPIVRAFVILVSATGLRRDEARTLQWGDIDLGARRIRLRRPKGVKLQRSGIDHETVSLPPIAAAALVAIRRDDAADTAQVFVPVRGRLIAVDRDFRRITREAGLPGDLVIHSLRHSIGTAAIVAGLSTAETKAMLRHRNISTTQRYVHLAEASRSRFQDRAIAHLMPGPVDADDDHPKTLVVVTQRRAGP